MFFCSKGRLENKYFFQKLCSARCSEVSSGGCGCGEEGLSVILAPNDMAPFFFFNCFFCLFCLSIFFLIFHLFNLFIYGCVGFSFLCEGFSLIAASGGHSSSWCAGLSLSRPLLLRSTGSRHAGSVIVAHGPSCSAACGIFPDRGSNPRPLHWQADSQPLRHQGSPIWLLLRVCVI